MPNSRNCCCETDPCLVIDEAYADLDDGDMPDGWDVDGTDWEIASGQAKGNGQLCHTIDTEDTAYIIRATFALGYLAVVGDSVTVELSHGTTSHSLTVTRIAGATGGDPDRYSLEWTPAGYGARCVDDMPATVELEICPSGICNDLAAVYWDATVTPGTVCVSITQPTLSGHTDAGMTAFSIRKSHEMDARCPCCDCNTCQEFTVMTGHCDCDWTGGGIAADGAIAAPGTTLALNQSLSARAHARHKARIYFDTNWASNATVGDFIEFSTAGGAVKVKFTVLYAAPACGVKMDLIGCTTGLVTTTFYGPPTGVEICVTGEMATATRLEGLAPKLWGSITGTPGGGVALTVDHSAGVTFALRSCSAEYLGSVTGADCNSQDCGSCELPCTICTDSVWPSEWLVQLAGITTWVAGLDCDDFNGSFYVSRFFSSLFASCNSGLSWESPSSWTSPCPSGIYCYQAGLGVSIMQGQYLKCSGLGLGGCTSIFTWVGFTPVDSHYYLRVVLDVNVFERALSSRRLFHIWAIDLTDLYGSSPFDCTTLDLSLPWVGFLNYGDPPSGPGCGDPSVGLPGVRVVAS